MAMATTLTDIKPTTEMAMATGNRYQHRADNVDDDGPSQIATTRPAGRSPMQTTAMQAGKPPTHMTTAMQWVAKGPTVDDDGDAWDMNNTAHRASIPWPA